ncbi:MAG TPA: energy transducer TonB, partial [Thermoanaerobaculia bacterium]|nr:energy transducer TonB [Thermoanaerobaculia bacterium]
AALAGAIATTIWAIDFPSMAPSQIVLYSLAVPLPPMPPPPPPPAGSRPVTAEPPRVPVRADELAPTMIPDYIPEVLPASTVSVADVINREPGVLYGIEGGVEGGVLGGIVGGMAGGVLGGVISGDPPEMLRAEYDVARPRFVSQMFPEYPEAARWRGIDGIVVVDYIIGKDGRVKDVIVLQEAHPLLTKAAVKAVQRWRFRPTLVNGQPVEVIHKLSIVFSLE